MTRVNVFYLWEKIEKIIFLTLLNEKYINDDTLKKILKPYSREELSYVVDNSIVVFNRNLYEHIDYNFSNITVDKTLCNLLTSIQNAYKQNDYKTVEKLCNQNYKKYNQSYPHPIGFLPWEKQIFGEISDNHIDFCTVPPIPLLYFQDLLQSDASASPFQGWYM